MSIENRICGFAISVMLFLLCQANLSFAAYHINQLISPEMVSVQTDRLLPETPGTYQFDYGEEATVVFSLPWAFSVSGASFDQITVGSNGIIWFGAVETGPLIIAWNADLNSYFHGGVFVEYQAGQNQVVVSWVTETFEGAGYGNTSHFQAVLSSDGRIQLNYGNINAVSTLDAGSGLYDGSQWTLLSSAVPALSGTSFSFTSIYDTDGDGVVDTLDNCPDSANPDQLNNDTDGLGDVCDPDDDNDGMSDEFESAYGFNPYDAADASLDADDDGLSNLGEFLANTDPRVANPFPYPVKLEGVPGSFMTIQQAYDSIGSGQVGTIKVKAGEQAPGDLMFDRDVTIRLEGGYDEIFSSVVSGTSFFGTLTVSGGPVTVSDLIIK